MKYLTNTAFAAALLFGSLSPVKAQTLGEAIRTGLESSPAVREAIEKSQVALHEVETAKSALRPQVQTHAMAGPAFRDRSIDGVSTGSGDTLWSREARVTVQQLLFDWGSTKQTVNSAEMRKRFHELLAVEIKEEQALLIAETYLDLYRFGLQAQTFRSHIDDMGSYRLVASEREDLEGDTGTIVVDGRISTAGAKLAHINSRIKALRSRFVLLTTLEPVGLKLGPVPQHLSEHYSIDQSPLIKAADMAIASSQANVQALRKDRAPKIFLEGRGGVGEDVLGIDGPDNEWAALAVIRWNPYEGGRKRSLVRGGDAEVRRDQAAKDDVIRSVNDEVALAQADVYGAAERHEKLEKAREDLGRALEGYVTKFEGGEKGTGILSLVNTRTELLAAELDSHNALIDSYRASFQGLKAAGALLGYFGLAGE